MKNLFGYFTLTNAAILALALFIASALTANYHGLSYTLDRIASGIFIVSVVAYILVPLIEKPSKTKVDE